MNTSIHWALSHLAEISFMSAIAVAILGLFALVNAQTLTITHAALLFALNGLGLSTASYVEPVSEQAWLWLSGFLIMASCAIYIYNETEHSIYAGLSSFYPSFWSQARPFAWVLIVFGTFLQLSLLHKAYPV